MNYEIRKSFIKDAAKLSAATQKELAKIIEGLELATQLSELKNCKKLKGVSTAYRIRLGQCRVCFFYENEIIELVRILAREDIYRYFP